MTNVLATEINSFNFQEFGKTVNVKDFDSTKLKYYLSCVNLVIGNIAYEYRNYEDYKYGDNISIKDLEDLHEILKICTPENMKNTNHFLEVESDSKVLNNYSNKFIEITYHDDVIGFGSNSKISIIDASLISIPTNVMFYKRTWSIQNFYIPFEKLENIIYNHYIQV
jgi:hypothetical protein